MRVLLANAALGDPAEREMRDITGDGAVIVILRDDDVGRLLPAELSNLVDDSAQDLIIHLRRVDRVVRPWPVCMIGGVGLLGPEDREVRSLRWKDVIHKDIG